MKAITVRIGNLGYDPSQLGLYATFDNVGAVFTSLLSKGIEWIDFPAPGVISLMLRQGYYARGREPRRFHRTYGATCLLIIDRRP